MLLGLNGYIWVSKHMQINDEGGDEALNAEAVYSNRNDVSIDRLLAKVRKTDDAARILTTPLASPSREFAISSESSPHNSFH